MDPLKEWYRYVDQVSRPSRRLSGGADEEPEPAAAPPTWRPWMESAPQEELEESVAPEAVPVLDLSRGAGQFTFQSPDAEPEYEDETIHDELAPVPDFEVPELQAPAFAVDAPRLHVSSGSPPAPAETPRPGAIAASRLDSPPAEPGPAPSERRGALFAEPPRLDLTPPTLHAPESPVPPHHAREAEGARGETSPGDWPLPSRPTSPESDRTDSRPEGKPADPADPGGNVHGTTAADSSSATAHWELLSRIQQTQGEAPGTPKPSLQETREELLQRLMDPPLSLEETARILGVSPATARRYAAKGWLPHFRTAGNQRRFRLSEVTAFLKTHAEQVAEDARADQESGLL